MSFRIRSLDGGSLRGAFSAAVLAYAAKDTGRRQGRYPGLVEEADLALEKPPLLSLIGSFGGAARAAIAALQGRTTPVLSRDVQEKGDPVSKTMLTVCDRAGAGQTDSKKVAASCSSKGVAFLSQHNGLSADENRRPFETPHIIERVYRVPLGLGRALRPRGGYDF